MADIASPPSPDMRTIEVRIPISAQIVRDLSEDELAAELGRGVAVAAKRKLAESSSESN